MNFYVIKNYAYRDSCTVGTSIYYAITVLQKRMLEPCLLIYFKRLILRLCKILFIEDVTELLVRYPQASARSG